MSEIKMIALALLFGWCGILSANINENMSYQTLDSKIVQAYNHNPRNTSNVYAFSRVILKKASDDSTTKGKAWILKARKLITVTCFYECTQAIDHKLYRDAFIWAMRGVKRGTTIGSIGNVSVKSLYQYLDYAIKELKNTPMVKNTSHSVLKAQVDDYIELLSSKKKTPGIREGVNFREKSPKFPRDLKNSILLEKMIKISYKLKKGPNNGRIFCQNTR